jgi:hypothetical protein
VAVQSTNGSAAAGEDYAAVGRRVSFPAGVSGVNVPLSMLDDALPEGDERFTVRLLEPVGALLGTQRTLTTTIRDNELEPTVFFETRQVKVVERTTTLVVHLRRTGDPTGPLSVTCAPLSGGTATDGVDFLGWPVPVTFAPGVDRATVELLLLDDALPEAEETVRLGLSDPIGGVLGTQSTTVVRISDPD